MIAYDNFNFKDSTRHETTGHRAEMRAVTTAIVVQCEDIPQGGLQQDAFSAAVPLSYEDFLKAPVLYGGAEDLENSLSDCLIMEAIQRMHRCN